MNQNARFSDYLSSRPASFKDSDLKLFQKIVAKNEKALEELYLRYGLSLYNYVLRIIHDPHAAEDILQEVFIGVWMGSGQFQGRAQVKTWLFRIAHYQTVSWLRDQKRYVRERDDAIENLEYLEDETPETLAFNAWKFSKIQKALRDLSADHREVVELSFTHGFSNAEIATILDCPVGTVKSRLYNALRNLNGLLAMQEIVNKVLDKKKLRKKNDPKIFSFPPSRICQQHIGSG